ncbi:MAG: stage III sporulation protein AE [Lawsonibacter sp.]|nr:stage III sporulation protein AE [Lawsonibacter sp.]
MRRVLLYLLLLILCASPCRGAQTLEPPGLDELWDQAAQYGVEEETDLENGLSTLFSQALAQVGDLLRRSAATGAKLMAVVLLCALAQELRGKEEGVQAVELAGAMSITALTMTDMAAMIGLGRETLEKMDLFSQALLPVMTLLTAATGRVTSAALRQGATVFFSQLLLLVMDRLLVPLVYAYAAVSCAQAAVDNPGLGKLAGLLKSTVTFLLTALLLAFVGYLTASGAIAGSVDASAVKAAKLAISRAIPVVGSILADASETVLAGAGVLRGTVGAAGMVAVLAICLTPFLRLALQYLVYKGTAALCAMVAQPRLSRLIDAIGSAFGLVLGMTGASALILLVSLASALTAVVP